MYRGFVPTLTGMVPYAGFSFYCFEYVKFFCMKYVPQWTCNKCDKNTGKCCTWWLYDQNKTSYMLIEYGWIFYFDLHSSTKIQNQIHLYNKHQSDCLRSVKVCSAESSGFAIANICYSHPFWQIFFSFHIIVYVCVCLTWQLYNDFMYHFVLNGRDKKCK